MDCFGRQAKEKELYCAIKLLDESEISFNIQRDTKGNYLLDRVYRHLNLVETDYFGLRYLDSYNQTHWLDATKAASKQIKNGPPFTLYFGVKFYTEDPCKLREEVTRYQFFLQIKMDMLQGRLPCTFGVAAELCAYAVQSELGDYDLTQHSTGYISEFRFVPNQAPELESQISDIHKSLRGQTPSVAELNFLERAKWLDMYGVDLHPVVGEDNIEYFLGLTPTGVVVYRNKSKVAQYFWPRISKIHFKEMEFTLKVRGKDGLESEYVFQLSSKPACKHLWKCCIEQHAFFRLPQSMEGGVLGRRSSLSSKQFRHSGRTQREAIDAASDMERPQPRVSRTPSRRYQRRPSMEGDSPHMLGSPTEGMVTMDTSGMMGNGVVMSPEAHSRAQTPVSRPTGRDSPTSGISTRSVPWESSDMPTGGLFTPAGTTPVSAYSSNQRRRSKSRGPSPGPRRYYSDWSGSESEAVYSWKKHNRRAMSEGGSDHEASHRRHHHHRHRRRRSRGGNTSGSESEHQYHDGRRHRHQRSSEHMIESESQWTAVQQGVREQGELREAGDSAVKKIGREGFASDTPVNRHQRHQQREYNEHHRWLKEKKKSQGQLYVEEIRRHIQPELVDPTQYTEDELRNIPYTNVDIPVRASNKKRPSLHRLHDDPTGSARIISDSEHSGRHSVPGKPPHSPRHRRHTNSKLTYPTDAQGTPAYSGGEESHSSRHRRERTVENTRNPPNGDIKKSPYTAYLRADAQPQRRPQVDQVIVPSHNDVARYTVDANSVPRYRDSEGGGRRRDVQQDAQVHDGVVDMKHHSREDSGIDEHDESVIDRASPIGQNGPTQDRSMSRHRPEPNHYHSNNYPPEPTPHQYQTSQQAPVNHSAHPAVDQGFRADSQTSVGPESAYCGSETHDPPLPVPSRIQMGTGRTPTKDHRRKPVSVPLTVAPKRDSREQRSGYQQNGHVQNIPRNQQYRTLPSAGTEYNHSNGNMEIWYEQESQLESNTWPKKPTQYPVNGEMHGGMNGGMNGEMNGIMEERPVAVEQKPAGVKDVPVKTPVDEIAKLQKYPQRGQRTGNRPMLGFPTYNHQLYSYM